MARRAAAINGDPAPAWTTAVMTTPAKALTSATPGDYVPGSARIKVFPHSPLFRGVQFGVTETGINLRAGDWR
jgi:hypothetical protein